MRFAFIDWICEYRELCVIVHVFFLWSFMIYFFVHCAFSFRLPLSSASIISTLFASVFSYVMMTCSCPGATGQACHTLHSTCRLWSRILRLRGDHLGWEVWGSFGWTMLVWHSTSFGCSTQIQKKKKVLVWYLLLYLGSSEVIWVWKIYYSSESWVRALCDPSPWI